MERSLARQLSNANRVGSSTAKGKQPARDSDSDSFDEEIVVARPRGQIRPSVLKPPNNSSESDGGVSISDGGVELASDDDSASEIEAKWAAFQESGKGLTGVAVILLSLRGR